MSRLLQMVEDRYLLSFREGFVCTLYSRRRLGKFGSVHRNIWLVQDVSRAVKVMDFIATRC